MPAFRTCVYQSRDLVETVILDEAVVVGRRDLLTNDPPPVSIHRANNQRRLIVADQRLQSIPRTWFEISPVGDDAFTIKNIHLSHPVPLDHESSIAVGEIRQFEREVTIDLGHDLVIRVDPGYGDDGEDNEYRSLDSSPPTPGQDIFFSHTKTIREFAAGDAEEIAKMLRMALKVVNQAAGSDAFFQSAVSATTDIVDLDRTVLLLRAGKHDTAKFSMTCMPDGWCVVARHEHPRCTTANQPVSTSLLNRAMQSATTVIHDPLRARSDSQQSEPLPPSLQNVACAVASPILNQDREVIGVLYGDRLVSDQSPSAGIDDLEATLVEILAGSVAGGIARRSEERLRNTLSEFFSPKVAGLLATNPELMEGQDAEVTVLFCDIRGFSSVTEKLGPKKAIAWINDVMSELSQCVIDRDGVLVDYVGDELFAMWVVPGDQPDHAARAIAAAQAMLVAIEELRSKWADEIPEKFGAGIGINTGPARVGNVGSRQKFKYGPLGNAVNVGSRLQSATKQLGVDCMASDEAVKAAGCIDQSRRLARIAVVGIEQPLDVYEIVAQQNDLWKTLARDYQIALSQFELGKFRESARNLGALLPQYPEDRPTRKLLARAVSELDEPTEQFLGILRLTSK